MPTRQNTAYFQKVPNPWEPIKRYGNKIQCWNREYELSKTGNIIDSIINAGNDILAEPVALQINIENKKIPWDVFNSEEEGPAGIDMISYTQSEKIDLKTVVSLDYDGMMKIACTVQPHGTIFIDSMRLKIPFRKEFAEYFHCANCTWSKSDAGLVPSEGWHSAFMPFIWIGNDVCGLCWFADSDKEWRVRETEQTLVISRQDSRTDLIVTMIDTPSQISQPFTITFGLLATPTKPIPQGYRKWRTVHLSCPRVGAHDNFDYPADFQAFNKYRVKTVVLHEPWSEGFGYPKPYHEEHFRKLIDKCHAQGIRMVVYFNPTRIGLQTPEYKKHKSEWQLVPDSTWPPEKYHTDTTHWRRDIWNSQVCSNSSTWADFFINGIAHMIDEYNIDGVYLDEIWPLPCSNKTHGCGYFNHAGEYKPQYNIFALREMTKRIYQFKSKKKDFLLFIHSSGNLFIPIYSFVDAYWDGEQFNMVLNKQQKNIGDQDDGTVQFNLEKFRAEFTGKQWGLVAEFLDYRGFSSYREAIALSLIHDVLPRPRPPVGNDKALGISFWDPGDTKLATISSIWDSWENFDIDTAKWFPYWKNQDYITLHPDSIKASFYLQRARKEILLVLSNLEEQDANVLVNLNFSALSLDIKSLKAYDVLNKNKILLINEKITVFIPGKDFVLIWLGSSI